LLSSTTQIKPIRIKIDFIKKSRGEFNPLHF